MYGSYIHMWVYTYSHPQTHMYTHMVYIDVLIQIFTCIYSYICTHMHTHACPQTPTHPCMGYMLAHTLPQTPLTHAYLIFTCGHMSDLHTQVQSHLQHTSTYIPSLRYRLKTYFFTYIPTL